MTTVAGAGRAQAPARQLGLALSETAANYLKTTPFVQWQRNKLQLTEADIIAQAAARGLRLVRAQAINTDDYEIFNYAGKLLRRGSISALRHFAENYKG